MPLLLRRVDRNRQQQVNAGFVLAIELFGGDDLVELIERRLRPLVLEVKLGDVDLLVDREARPRVDEQVRCVSEQAQ